MTRVPRPALPERGDERLRLFVALELPDAVREALARWRSRALEHVGGMRLVAREDLHATLCFLGWRSVAEVQAIRGACGLAAGEPAPRLELGDALWLPPRRARVLAVELRDREGTLARIQAVVSEALTAGGWYQPEKRRYLGHVTVARVSRGAAPPRRALPPPPRLAFEARHVTLYRSRLLRTGARYEPLEGVTLGHQSGRVRP